MDLITSSAGLESWLSDAARKPATFIAIDFQPHEKKLDDVVWSGSVILGCRLSPKLLSKAATDGAQIASALGDIPRELDPFRTELYTVPDLYTGMSDDGEQWFRTPDYTGYAWFMDPDRKIPRQLDLAQQLGAVLHDTIQETLAKAFLKNRHVIAIMGGHDIARKPSGGARDIYWECVMLAKRLTERGFMIISGGGPGLMEASHLGALLANADEAVVAAVDAARENHKYNSAGWRRSARVMRDMILPWNAVPAPHQWSLGIPTWYYGHEPPNLFATHHAKMFYNSLREDGLVTLANSGIVFFEGNAGTVQEIFQDATQNYYLGKGQSPTPMVFFNAGNFWNRQPFSPYWPSATRPDKTKPLLPLIHQMAAEKNFLSSILVSDRSYEIVDFLQAVREAARPKKADYTIGNALADKHGNV